MINLDGNQRDLENHKYYGLKESGRTTLRCSDCNKPLVDIVQTSIGLLNKTDDQKKEKTKLEKQTDRYKALCCFCGDSSYPVSTTGKVVFQYGAYGTVLTDMYEEKGVQVIVTQKEQKND